MAWIGGSMEFVMTVVTWVSTYWMDVLQIVSYIVLAASVAFKFTKTDKDDKIAQKILAWLSLARK